MTFSRSSDASLYELAIGSEQTSQPLQISPTTFKSMVGLFLDLLIDRGIPATLWLKLPKGEAWRAEIQRFCQAATASYSMYSLHTHQEMQQATLLWNYAAAKPFDKNLLEDWKDTTVSAEAGSQVHALPLAAESQLKREYFLLVAAPEFYGLVLAHRPRSSRSKLEGGQVEDKIPVTGEEALEQKHPLLGLCTFEPATIQRVLDGINRAICFGQPAMQSSDAIQKLLVNWEQLISQGWVSELNPALLSNLLNKQFQRQEEIWRSGTVHRRQAESSTALRLENEELLSSLRQKDDFIKTMGQELRTPLTSMKTALSLLNSASIKPPQKQRYMDMLSHECDRQSSLITSVLDLIQIESTVDQVPLEALRLSEIVPGIVSTYQPLAQEKGVTLAYTIPDELLPVSCLSHRLKQIVINLLHNSIKFTACGGQVWVRAKQQGDYVQLEFRDTGIGIAQSDLPKIFDRFYRVRIASGEDSSGSGLGLAIVQQLLLRCGGSISVKSKVGEGSAFIVLLPIYSG